MNYPHYAKVPKDFAGNIRFRQKLRRGAQHDKAMQKALIRACAEDTLFFLNAFCWAYEPRNADGAKIIPFITWDEQDEYFSMLDAGWGRRDLWCEKRRAAGFSTCTLNKMLKEFLFSPGTSMGLISKDEPAVDNPDNSGSLMWKLDWQLKQLPVWMRPEVTRNVKLHTLYNVKMDSGFVGTAATANAFSGQRMTAVMLDELGKWRRGPDRQVLNDLQHVTNCRIVGSSYFGRSGAFYETLKFNPHIRKFIFDWTKNQLCNRGLYRVTGENVVAVDESNPLTDELLDLHLRDTLFPPDQYGENQPHVTVAVVHKALLARGFKIEGTMRSPWYDNECLRATGPQTIAEELDRDPQGTESNYIDPSLLRDLLEGEEGKRTAKPPLHRGEFIFDGETLEGKFVETADGPLLIWCKLEKDQAGEWQPPRDTEYVEGCDISYGAGASNSVIHVGDAMRREQVAEFVHAHLSEALFCRLAMAIGKWFSGRSGMPAYLAWEANGSCGRNFTASVTKFSYGNAYRRKAKEVWYERFTDKLGWHSHNNDKTELLGGVDGGGLKQSLMERSYAIRSADCLIECGQYVIDDNQKVIHLKSKNNPVAAGRNEAHGDRVIAAGLARHLLVERPAKPEVAAVAPLDPRAPGYAESVRVARVREFEERMERANEVAGEFVYE